MQGRLKIKPAPSCSSRPVMDKLKQKCSVSIEREIYLLRLPFKLKSICVSMVNLAKLSFVLDNICYLGSAPTLFMVFFVQQSGVFLFL